MTVHTIPVLNASRPYQGVCVRPPWEYEVCAAIPVINGVDRLKLVVQLLRLQTLRPFIVLIDTGSRPDQFMQIEKMRDFDLEVHSLRMNGMLHSSEPVSTAMDVAQSLCRSRFMFCTHDDCFLMRRDALHRLRDLAAKHGIAGHQLTPRPHDDWVTMVGHTLLMYDCDVAIRHGMSWSMRRCAHRFGLMHTQLGQHQNWPDTEVGFNYCWQAAGYAPYLTGTERNWARNTDEWIDHCRTAGSAELYDPKYREQKSARWLEQAQHEATQRIVEWSTQPFLPVDRLPPVVPEALQQLPHMTKNFFGGYAKYLEAQELP